MNTETLFPILVAALVPSIIAGLRMLAAEIPPRWKPVAAPLIGGAVEALGRFAGMIGPETAGGVGVLAGMAGVGLREALDQNLPGKHGPSGMRHVGGALVMLAALGAGGCLVTSCAAVPPQVIVTQTEETTTTVLDDGTTETVTTKSSDTTVDLGRYALLDGMPGEQHQQHEATTATGVSFGDSAFSLGIFSRDDTVQPVSEAPLHGVAFRRTQTVGTALGDSIASDLTTGAEAFDPEAEEGADGATVP